MVHDRLQNRDVYKQAFDDGSKWYPDKRFNQDAKDIIDKCVRRLVLAIKSIEMDGVETREDIEDYVIRAFEQAEYLYYGLSELELMTILDMEKKNDKARVSFYSITRGGK